MKKARSCSDRDLFEKREGRWGEGFNTDTVAPRNTGRQGTHKFHLLLVDFCYRQYRKLNEMF